MRSITRLCCTRTRFRRVSTIALLAALTFAVATLGINVVANFVSPAFDFANVFPSKIDFKKGGYIAALIALVLYPFGGEHDFGSIEFKGERIFRTIDYCDAACI
jgi:hypothetical protein